MKFDDLYNRVFVNEQDEAVDTTSEVADPNDPAYDVEPMPLPETPLATDGSDSGEASETATTSVTDYIKLTLDFTKKMQDAMGGESLQTLMKSLDYPGSGFDDQSKRMSSKILTAVKAVQDVTADLVALNIHAAKNKS
jgi:hypothetical protein